MATYRTATDQPAAKVVASTSTGALTVLVLAFLHARFHGQLDHLLEPSWHEAVEIALVTLFTGAGTFIGGYLKRPNPGDRPVIDPAHPDGGTVIG